MTVRDIGSGCQRPVGQHYKVAMNVHCPDMTLDVVGTSNYREGILDKGESLI